MNINDALIYGRQYLLNTNIQNIPLKVRLLLEHTLNMNKYELVINHTQEIDTYKLHQFTSGLEKIKNNTPIQYIINNQEFMKMNFYVDENVLIPQPDTEILVEEVIKIAGKMNNPKILDLCTGSGAIAISIAKNVPDAEVYAIDISQKAIEVAKKNAKQLGAKVKFIKSNLFHKIEKTKFDIIVSNPPYIKKDVMKSLSEEVRKEPELALDGGIDGLDFYRKITKQAIDYLKFGSYLCYEIGYDQKEEVIEIINEQGNYSKPYCKKDLGGNDRIIVTQVN